MIYQVLIELIVSKCKIWLHMYILVIINYIYYTYAINYKFFYNYNLL